MSIKIGSPGKPNTYSLTENPFSGKTYFYTLASRNAAVRGDRAERLKMQILAQEGVLSLCADEDIGEEGRPLQSPTTYSVSGGVASPGSSTPTTPASTG